MLLLKFVANSISNSLFQAHWGNKSGISNKIGFKLSTGTEFFNADAAYREFLTSHFCQNVKAVTTQQTNTIWYVDIRALLQIVGGDKLIIPFC